MLATASSSRETRVQRVGSLVRWSIPRHTRPATHSSSWEKIECDNIVQAIAADLGEESKDAKPDFIRQPAAGSPGRAAGGHGQGRSA